MVDGWVGGVRDREGGVWDGVYWEGGVVGWDGGDGITSMEMDMGMGMDMEMEMDMGMDGRWIWRWRWIWMGDEWEMG